MSRRDRDKGAGCRRSCRCSIPLWIRQHGPRLRTVPKLSTSSSSESTDTRATTTVICFCHSAKQRDGCIHTMSKFGRWFRELQHFGFIRMTEPGSLGVDGKGKAPHWRLTELGYKRDLPTRDFEKWNGAPFVDSKTESRGGKPPHHRGGKPPR